MVQIFCDVDFGTHPTCFISQRHDGMGQHAIDGTVAPMNMGTVGPTLKMLCLF